MQLLFLDENVPNSCTWSISNMSDRFSAGVVHSFTGSAEDCNKVLSFSNLFIGEPFVHCNFNLELISVAVLCFIY